MPFLVRLRIALADQPGALARVAAVIAEHGGNITAVDVHRAGVNAVDDVVVEWPDDTADIDRLRDALAGSGAGDLRSHQAARQVDPVVAALRRAVDIVAAGGGDSDLIAAVAEVCASPAVWISPAGEDTAIEAGRMAREGGGAVSVRTTELPAAVAERLPGEAWLLAVPDPEVVGDGRVVFVARGPQSEFTNTEIARIEALMDLDARVARMQAGR
ncbi:ACT domain-containing protein [Acidiferrimicrobium sp. IK]|uniref:ACT domain-containing protein n=1 Tax=Acidiferrimicrobium sp. IK TaxID=2871700 RepID=UPI0021CB8526|nr:ACT domain-containing protein [Acidiferrimicrobium sp. IK]MCU4183723.1 ACT domain-containing protein [Acidiferrimicrobium sp. IK]